MKTLYKLFAVALFLTASLNSGMSQVHPTFDMTLKNITTLPNAVTGADSVIRFDIYLLWTNSAAPGVNEFEFGAAQYNITYNPAMGNASNLIVTKIAIPGAGNLQAGNQPPTFQIAPDPGVDGRPLLQASSNLPDPTRGDVILATGNGTRTVRMQIRTSAHIWPVVPPDFKFQLTPPNNTFLAYFLPPVDPKDPDNQLLEPLMDTVINHYTVEGNAPLPVELASFTSSVNKNTVALAWATATETNNQGFDIERSAVGSTEWSKVGYVNGNGTTNETKNYTYNDRVQAPGSYVYRLKQIDFNGNFEYHNLTGEVIVGIPSTYAISQNYPNPFNPSTKIDFDLPYDGKVSILLYDISGREVGKLVNEVKTAGYYTVNFNASNLSSGMYFYRITAEGNGQNFVQTKKMVLIK